MVLQSVPRKSVAKQAALARRLIATSTIARHVLNSTIEYQSEKPVIRCRAHEGSVVGQVAILNGDLFYLVASRFAGRYYVVVNQQGTWTCSSKDERVAAHCITQVQARNTQKAALLIGDSYERLA